MKCPKCGSDDITFGIGRMLVCKTCGKRFTWVGGKA